MVPAAGVEPASSLYESAALTVELGGRPSATGGWAQVYRDRMQWSWDIEAELDESALGWQDGLRHG